MAFLSCKSSEYKPQHTIKKHKHTENANKSNETSKLINTSKTENQDLKYCTPS